VGLNGEARGLVGDVVWEVTYNQSHLKGTHYSSGKKYKRKAVIHIESTTEMEILEDLDHEPWILQHLYCLAYTSGYEIIKLGDGAKFHKNRTKKKNTNHQQKESINSKMWSNTWTSGESEMVCGVSTISNLLYFLGDNETGEAIQKLRNISLTPTLASKLYPNVKFDRSIRYNELDMLIKVLCTEHKYFTQPRRAPENTYICFFMTF
jgi:hypothetical protein